MNWMLWYNVIMRYYPGENLQTIPKMTVWQFVQTIRNIGWLEKQAQEEQHITSSADKIMGMKPGEVPKVSEIQALAKRINKDLVIPKD